MIADFALVLFALLVFLTIKYGGGFLRAAALIVVFFLIANPSFRKKSRAPSPVLAVCLDTSSSMGVKERGSSRIDKARALIRKELPVLKKKFTLLFYAFDSGVRPLDEKDFFKVKPSGKASLISQNAAAITASLPEGASMLLFSDGRDTSPEGHYFSKPVHCAGLGLSAVNDISVKMLSYPEKAFQGAVSKVRVRVERTGGAGFCRVRIRRRGEIAGEKEINFAEGESLKDCDVEFVPREAGNSLKYRVELSPSDGKPENNSDFFTVSVFKSKIKVMFISGRPGWEYRNLRALIKSDKRIDLTSFVILRNPADYVPFPDNKLSLIPFPVREIFLKDITQYDLVILLNFDYTMFLSPDYLLPLARHVESGGALMLIGGENFSKAGYFKSPLSGILPFKSPGAGAFSEENFFIKASPSHPVTSFISGILPGGKTPLKGMSSAGNLAPGAESVLETIPDIGGSVNSSPVAAVKTAGRGRVMVMLTNSLWRLFFAGGEGAYFYQEFFKNSFAWLTRSPLLDEISLSGRRSYKTGEEFSLRINVRKSSGGRPGVTHIAPGGKTYLSPVMISPGVFSIKKILAEPGSHRVKISLSGERGVRAEKVFSFVAEKTGIEDENLSANHSYLREISRLSLGKYIESDSFRAGDIPSPEDNSGFCRPAMTNYYLIFTALFFAFLWFQENKR